MLLFILASMGLIFFSIGGIFANLFSNSLINLFTEKVVGCYFVMIGASIMFLSLLTNNFYIILVVLMYLWICYSKFSSYNNSTSC